MKTPPATRNPSSRSAGLGRPLRRVLTALSVAALAAFALMQVIVGLGRLLG